MKELFIKIWKSWFGKEAEPVEVLDVEDVQMEAAPATEKEKAVSSMLEKLEVYLFAKYEFRFNVLTEQAEFRPKGKGDFRLVDQRALNTFCMEARKQGINCWDKDVSRLLLSQEIPDFHPFRMYCEGLPEWDGEDRVTELAQRVSDEAWWVKGFHRWMLGMVAQWMGMDILMYYLRTY